MKKPTIEITTWKRGDTAQWKVLQTACRKRPKDIWIPYAVSGFWRAAQTTANSRVVAMTASQMRIAETIDAFYGDAGAKDGVSRSYKQAVEDLDAETIKALDGPYR